MKIYCFQHVPFEGPAYIADWTCRNGLDIRQVALFKKEPLPDPDQLDALVVMGGPMGVNDEDRHPWLKPEIAFIAEVIDQGKTVLGICLGAQLIAAALGARVYPNDQKEIGWFNVTKTAAAGTLPCGAGLPPEFTALHWHGDTFDLPQGAVHLAQSEACRHQAFSFGEHVLGLQFHLESTRTSVAALIENCGDELVTAPYIQSADQIRQGMTHIENNNRIMAGLMEKLF